MSNTLKASKFTGSRAGIYQVAVQQAHKINSTQDRFLRNNLGKTIGGAKLLVSHRRKKAKPIDDDHDLKPIDGDHDLKPIDGARKMLCGPPISTLNFDNERENTVDVGDAMEEQLRSPAAIDTAPQQLVQSTLPRSPLEYLTRPLLSFVGSTIGRIGGVVGYVGGAAHTLLTSPFSSPSRASARLVETKSLDEISISAPPKTPQAATSQEPHIAEPVRHLSGAASKVPLRTPNRNASASASAAPLQPHFNIHRTLTSITNGTDGYSGNGNTAGDSQASSFKDLFDGRVTFNRETVFVDMGSGAGVPCQVLKQLYELKALVNIEVDDARSSAAIRLDREAQTRNPMLPHNSLHLGLNLDFVSDTNILEGATDVFQSDLAFSPATCNNCVKMCNNSSTIVNVYSSQRYLHVPFEERVATLDPNAQINRKVVSPEFTEHLRGYEYVGVLGPLRLHGSSERFEMHWYRRIEVPDRTRFSQEPEAFCLLKFLIRQIIERGHQPAMLERSIDRANSAGRALRDPCFPGWVKPAAVKLSGGICLKDFAYDHMRNVPGFDASSIPTFLPLQEFKSELIDTGFQQGINDCAYNTALEMMYRFYISLPTGAREMMARSLPHGFAAIFDKREALERSGALSREEVEVALTVTKEELMQFWLGLNSPDFTYGEQASLDQVMSVLLSNPSSSPDAFLTATKKVWFCSCENCSAFAVPIDAVDLGFQSMVYMLVPNRRKHDVPFSVTEYLIRLLYNPDCQPRYDPTSMQDLKTDICFTRCGLASRNRIRIFELPFIVPLLLVINVDFSTLLQNERHFWVKTNNPEVGQQILDAEDADLSKYGKRKYEPAAWDKDEGRDKRSRVAEENSDHLHFIIDWETMFGLVHRYRLFGVMYHLGEATSGHYIMRFRDGDTVYEYDGMKSRPIRIVGTARRVEDRQRLIPSSLPGKGKAASLVYSKCFL